MTQMTLELPASEPLLIGLVSISDRASSGAYEDKGIPALKEWFAAALATPWRMETRLIPDEQPVIEQTLIELCDSVGCHLVLTTGGTGPAPRDVTPEATLAVAHKVMPGFGEQMRAVSLKYVPTAILSRQVGAIRQHARGKTLILNLPGQPKAIKETLDGIFAAVPYCLDLIGAPQRRDARGSGQGLPAEVGSSGKAAASLGLFRRGWLT